MVGEDKPTVAQSGVLNDAFDYFNEKLFNNEVRKTMIGFSRNKQIIGGYFSPERWFNAEDPDTKIHEIVINANIMSDGDIERIMSILVHEMCHAWQEDNGKPSRSGYHNKEWAAKALEVGLEPRVYTKDGELVPDTITGQRVNTYTIPDGPFEKALMEMPEDTILPWLANELYPNMDEDKGSGSGDGKPGEIEPTSSRQGKRSKYTCPGCGNNAWAKGGIKLMCGSCNMDMVETITKTKK